MLSVVFVGIAQLGTYMTYFYDLCAAIDELSIFYNIEQEELTGEDDDIGAGSSVAFVNARGTARGVEVDFDFEIPDCSRVLACSANHSVQRTFTNFMKRHDVPTSGYITVGGHDTKSIKGQALRHEVVVVDRPTVIEMTIREYLRLSARDVSSDAILEALRVVELEEAVAELDKGLDTPMASTGWPLSMTETLRLKLAAVLIARPKILVIGPVYDILPAHILRRTLDALQADCSATVLRFSLRQEPCRYDHYLYLGPTDQRVFQDIEEFKACIKAHADEVQDPIASISEEPA